MIQIFLLVGALAVSLILVIKSADVFVDNLIEIGSALGISQIILGVTASAMGTSLPEFGSALIASLSGSVDIGVGTVIGSNIWNIAGILGISATVAGGIGASKEGLNRDWLMTLATGLILLFFMFFGDINWVAALVMVSLYGVYLWLLIKSQRSKSILREQKYYQNNHKPEKKVLDKKKLGFALLGLLGLIVGCRILVYSGVELARIAGIPEMIMGLFTLAIGTSIPELVVTLSSAMKGLHDLSIGTVLGSNTFNILIGIGIPALILGVPVERLSIVFDAPVMILVTVLLMVLIRTGKMKLNRSGGIILIGTYLSYAIIRIFILS
ncbi:calcium/sodium antiporter [Methanobacterium sp. CWC-01]|uniref:calcium/sodium antiporter n=1 Tax=Methanobacterium aridiramus TaxID=2584467 RepID=UPI0025773818|nr:calcium/sodium antiporter [Methanobacterium sp. CWC-01]WJI09769.1 calcium/sodium antiporter [Methanobacterium sp. CWC-01]